MPAPNTSLRRCREVTPSRIAPRESMGRAELADAVNRYLWETTAKRYHLDSHTIARYERGDVRWPSAPYRSGLRAVLNAASDSDLGFRPTPRGNTTAPPRTATGSGADHQSNTDLGIVDMTARTGAVAADHVVGGRGSGGVDALRRNTPTVETSCRLVGEMHRTYQAAQYAEAARRLPSVIETVNNLVAEGPARDGREALTLQCSVQIAAAKLATKVGDGAGGWTAAEHAARAAEEAEDVFGQAAAAYQRTCALLRIGRSEDAEKIAISAADAVHGNDPQSLTWRGALTLISAIIAARRDDATEAICRLDHATDLARLLGEDANIGWTAFGPTNVLIHRLSVAVDLNDPYKALSTAERIDIIRLPAGLHGRQAQFYLDSAWAHAQMGEDAEAVIHLLDTERVAPELVGTNSNALALIQDLLDRERRRAVPGLRGLARRAGVAA